MIRTGIDIVKIERIESLYMKKNFDDFLLSDYEKKYIQNKMKSDKTLGSEKIHYQTIAGIYACKEAVTKALGIGLSKKLNFKEVQILHDKNGAPFVQLVGYVKEVFDCLNAKEISVSISHDAGIAAAVCVIL